MKNKYKELVVVLLFALLSIFVFRDYFFKKTVPFPANLLVAFYQPWASYEWKGYPSGPPNKPIGFDNLRIFYPLRKLTVDQIKNFELPLWNPYDFSGNTQLATYQSAVFHPLSFLFFVLPQIDAWSVIIILTPFFASLFMYFFLKELLLSKKASIFGAIIFAFSGFMIVWWEESFMSSYSALFLPLILYGAYKSCKKISVLSFLAIVLGLSFSILSGWFQMSFYVWIFSLVWMILVYLKEHSNKKYLLFYFPLSLVLAVMISSAHLIPSLEAYFYSARGTTDVKFIFETYLAPIYHLVTYLAPDFFGNPGAYNYLGSGFYYEKIIFIGIPALIFGLYELIHFKKIDYKENFFKIVFLTTLSLGFALPTSWFLLYQLKLPFISVILPSRIFFLSTFCLSILASFGIEKFLKGADKKKILIILILLGIAFIFLWAGAIYYQKTAHVSNKFSMVPFKNIILPSVIYFITGVLITLYLKIKRFKNFTYIVIITISFLSSAYFANKYLYFSDRKLVFPSTPVLSQLKNISGIDRFWSVGKGYIERNFATYYSLSSPEGYDSFYIRRYGELFHAAQNNGKYSTDIQRADAKLTDAENVNQILEKDPYRRKLISLLGVKYIVEKNNEETDSKESIDSLRFKAIWKDDKFTIYEYKDAMPRVILTSDYLVLKEPQEIFDKLFSSGFNHSKTVILEEKPEKLDAGLTKKDVKLISYKPNKIIINTTTDKKALLFLSDNYYPGWKAHVDNKKVKIYRADYSFRSVVVPEGKHLVTFEYKPKSFYIGAIISLLGLLVLLIICLKIRYNSFKT